MTDRVMLYAVLAFVICVGVLAIPGHEEYKEVTITANHTYADVRNENPGWHHYTYVQDQNKVTRGVILYRLKPWWR